MPARTFPRAFLSALDASKILGVRAGNDHRFTGVWVVVLNGRIFARSWGDKPNGWYRAFLDEPDGAIHAPGVAERRVRGKRVRGERLLDAIDAAYAEKYHTRASLKWVRGFATKRRRATTIEFVPR
jgi:hypothetical protein